MRFLPVFLDLTQGAVGLAGSGPAAQSKLRLLRSAGARVRWFAEGADAIEDHLAADLHSGGVEISRADPRQAGFSGLIADLSTFIFPAIVDRGEVVVAIGTGGAAPVLARRLRERIEALLPARIGDLAALMGRFRAAAHKRRGADSRRRFWERVVDGPIGAAALAGRWHEAETALARATERPDDWHGRSGTVFLVGAGPGDPDLLTLRALEALQGADVVLYDETVSVGILDRARRDAERIFVGRRAGGPAISQDAINRHLADAARQGRNAVRLKGGDPFSSARGGEEIDYLRHAGVAGVAVPGVTVALARGAVAALPPASEIAA